MKTRHSSRLKTASEKQLDQSLNSSEGDIQRRIKPSRRRKEFDDGSINKEDDGVRDLLVLINGHMEQDPEEGSSVQVDDRGLDFSDEQFFSSTASSPQKVKAHNKKGRPLTGQCPSCRKLYQRAKKLKTPIKDKLLDNDPTSLTCDQWVLLKKWQPSRRPHSGKLSKSVLLVQKRLKGKKKAKQNKQDEHKNVCSRLHVFLQRNLSQARTMPVRKERKRKQRKRAKDEASQIAKQRCLPGISSPQYNKGNSKNKNSFSSSCAYSDVEEFHDGERANETHSIVSPEISLTLKPTKPRDIPSKPKAKRKKAAVQDLPVQYKRGNSKNKKTKIPTYACSDGAEFHSGESANETDSNVSPENPFNLTLKPTKPTAKRKKAAVQDLSAQYKRGNNKDKNSFFSACAGSDVEEFHNGQSANETNSIVSPEIPLTLKPTKPRDIPSKPKAKRKKAAVQDLPVQYKRGNSKNKKTKIPTYACSDVAEFHSRESANETDSNVSPENPFNLTLKPTKPTAKRKKAAVQDLSAQYKRGNNKDKNSFFSAYAGSDVEEFHSGRSANETNSNLSPEIPLNLNLKHTKPRDIPSKPKANRKKAAVQALPAQYNRGNNKDKNSFFSAYACSDVEEFHSGESANETNSNVSPESLFYSTLKPTTPRDIPPKPKAPTKKTAFQDLLAQLRGNRSIIVTETE